MVIRRMVPVVWESKRVNCHGTIYALVRRKIHVLPMHDADTNDPKLIGSRNTRRPIRVNALADKLVIRNSKAAL